LVVDSRRKDFTRVLRLAKLSGKGAVLICKNANFISKMDSGYIWRSVVARGSRRLVRSVFLPVGKGIHMAHLSAAGGGENSVAAVKHKARVVHSRWIKHVDQRSGDVHFIRKWEMYSSNFMFNSNKVSKSYLSFPFFCKYGWNLKMIMDIVFFIFFDRSLFFFFFLSWLWIEWLTRQKKKKKDLLINEKMLTHYIYLAFFFSSSLTLIVWQICLLFH